MFTQFEKYCFGLWKKVKVSRFQKRNRKRLSLNFKLYHIGSGNSYPVQWFSQWGPRTSGIGIVRILTNACSFPPSPHLLNQKLLERNPVLCVVIDPPGEFWCLLKLETHCSLLCCRSVKALVTLWFLARESATNTFTWSAWGCHHSPMGSSSAWNVKPVSFLVLLDMKRWIRRNVQCQHLPWYLIFLPLLYSSYPPLP